MSKRTLICQQWEESEQGWGARPDGYSLHLTEEDRKAYVDAFWAAEKKRNPSQVVPFEYTRQVGTPYATEVDEETYQKVVEGKSGARFYGPMPAGAKDGWTKVTPVSRNSRLN